MSKTVAFKKGLMELIKKIPSDGKYVPVHGVAVLGLQVSVVDGDLLPQATFWTSMGLEATLLMLDKVREDIKGQLEKAAEEAKKIQPPDVVNGQHTMPTVAETPGV